MLHPTLFANESSPSPAPIYDVLGLGCAAVDDLIFVEAFPQPDAKTRVLRRERHCGGLTTTALVAAARLEARCAYAGTLGHNDLSQFVLETLKREKVNVEHVVYAEGASPVHATIIVAKQEGSRNILVDAVGQTGACDDAPSAEVIRRSKVLFLDQYNEKGNLRAARLAREAGIPVVADFEDSTGPNFGQLLGLVDHLLLSQSFAYKLSGEITPERALKVLHSPERAVTLITMGVQGGWYLTQDAPQPYPFPAFQVPVVDTTGCGDAFHGTYAAGLAWEMEVETRIRLASAVAAMKAMHAGGQQGLPGKEALEEFIAQYESHTKPPHDASERNKHFDVPGQRKHGEIPPNKHQHEPAFQCSVSDKGMPNGVG